MARPRPRTRGGRELRLARAGTGPEGVFRRLFFGTQLYRHRREINPDLEQLEDESDMELQLRKIEVRDANGSIHYISFLYEERGAASEDCLGHAVPRKRPAVSRRASKGLPRAATSRAATYTSCSTARAT